MNIRLKWQMATIYLILLSQKNWKWKVRIRLKHLPNQLQLSVERITDTDCYLGACGGSCACSTCHVIVEGDEMYEKIPEPDDDENDMLDLAFGLTETSRLGCQVKMTKELDGLKVKLPSMTRNLQASDFSGAKKS